jgi:hypothetical protein
MGMTVTDIDVPAKPITITKLRRGDDKPVSRWRRNAFFGAAYANFEVREDGLLNLADQTPPRPNRFRRGDDPQPLPETTQSQLRKRADVILGKREEPFIAPIPKSRLMAGR